MKKIIVALTILFMLAIPAWATNTTERTENIIHITLDGSTAWNGPAELNAKIPLGCLIYSVGVFPHAANDIVTIRNGGATNPVIFKYKGVSGDSFWFNYPFPIECKPYIKGDEATGSIEIFLYVISK